MEAQGRWLPVRHAAQQLGISERSIRRYLRAGVYHGRLIAGNTQVWLPATGDTSLPVSDASSGSTGSTGTVLPDMSGTTGEETTGATGNQGNEGTLAVIELARLLREALDGKSTAEQAAAMWQERARNLEAENGRLQELLALPAHEEEPESPRHWWQWWRTRA